MAGFVVDYGPGKLVFRERYTWPNLRLRFDENATTDLWVRVRRRRPRGHRQDRP